MLAVVGCACLFVQTYMRHFSEKHHKQGDHATKTLKRAAPAVVGVQRMERAAEKEQHAARGRAGTRQGESRL